MVFLSIRRRLLLCSLLILVSPWSIAKRATELKVAILSADPLQIEAYSNWANKFEDAHPDIRLDIDYFSDDRYKQGVRRWLQSGEYDLLYWQAGRRLDDFAQQGLLAPLASLLDEATLSGSLPDSVWRQVSHGKNVYALPFAQYAWGFYYNKALFDQFNLSAPDDWQSFITLCESLVKHGIPPLVQANQEDWPVLAWLDYLAFQTGNGDVRKKLLNQVPLTSDEQVQLLTPLRHLVESEYFLAPEHPWRWQDTVHAVQRKRAAMTLTGQFAESIINPQTDSMLGFFPFPGTLDKGTELTPMEVFVVSDASVKKAAASKVLSFLLSSGVQHDLAVELGLLPVMLSDTVSSALTGRQQLAMQHLRQITKRGHYFDRETDQASAKRFHDALVYSIANHEMSALAALLGGQVPVFEQQLVSDKHRNRFYLSTIRGHKATFLATSLMREVYDSLGYDLVVNRFPSTKSAIEAQQFGMNGELVRIAEFETMSDKFVRVPEPLLTQQLVQVSKGPECSDTMDKIASDLPIGVSSDALVFQLWAQSNEQRIVRFPDQHAMWKALFSSEIHQVLAFESDLVDIDESTHKICATPQRQVSLHHYLNRDNADLVPAVNDAIKQFKHTATYARLVRRFNAGESPTP